ncbi:uncharacterized protein LOC126733497 [Anthonomus grandis grandis]|uniref:uncharacterized protein LOC126733497 n=1 Tax=Anthonomus grandis grandis TaxID=2921223 RepID=UPI00216698A9|nr:uncharacterized protein LOC126733497 [Anthonomus grandis grandis]
MSDSEETTHIVLDTERIIVEVEKRPALYNKELKEYSDRNAKEKLWTEVCANVIPKWHELSGAERKDRGKELQKEWKNLKDRFIKDIKVQKDIASGSAASKKRKYIFADIMQFLLPELKDRSTDTNIPETDIGTHDINDSKNISKEDEASGVKCHACHSAENYYLYPKITS